MSPFWKLRIPANFWKWLFPNSDKCTMGQEIGTFLIMSCPFVSANVYIQVAVQCLMFRNEVQNTWDGECFWCKYIYLWVDLHIYVKHCGNNTPCIWSILDGLVVTTWMKYMCFGVWLTHEQGQWLLKTECPVQDFVARFRNFPHGGSEEIYWKSWNIFEWNYLWWKKHYGRERTGL